MNKNILFLTMLLLLSGCSSVDKKDTNSEILTKQNEQQIDFETAITEKNIDFLKSYVEQNIYNIPVNDTKQINQFKKAIAILFNSNEENRQMLLHLFHNLVKDSNALLASKLIISLKNEENKHYIENFSGYAESYVNELELIENHDEEVAKAQLEFNNLMLSYPFPTDFTGEKLKILNSVIKQKVDDNEYLIEIYGENMILKTFDTVFSSTGRFTINAIEGPKKSYTGLNGFQQTLTVWYEVPDSYLQQADELLKAKQNVEETKSKIDEYFGNLEYYTDSMGTIINNIFNSNAPEHISEEIFEERDGFSLYGVKLGDSSSKVDEVFGDDYTNETDPVELAIAESSEIRYYENTEILFYNNKIIDIYINMSEKDFKEKILNKSTYQKLISPASTENEKDFIIIYNPNTTEILSGRYDETGEFYVSLSFDDGNFSYWLNEGFYKPYSQ